MLVVHKVDAITKKKRLITTEKKIVCVAKRKFVFNRKPKKGGRLEYHKKRFRKKKTI